MNYFKTILVCLLIGGGLAFSQSAAPLSGMPGEGPRNPYGHSMLNYRIYSFADSADLHRTTVESHFALVNDMLTFIKKSDTWYRAKFELSVILYNKKKEVVGYQNFSDTVSVANFAETNSRQRPMLKKMEFSLAPDEYDYKVELNDSETEMPLGRMLGLKVQDYSKPSLQISDLVFTQYSTCTGGLRHFVANLRDSFNEERAEIGVYFELYAESGRDSVTVTYTLSQANGQQVGRQRYRLAPGRVLPQCLALQPLITKPGEYLLNVEAVRGAVRAKAQRALYVHWGDRPAHPATVDAVVEQLALIAHGSEMNKLRNAPAAEKQKLIEQFWLQRDPTPGTAANELREEFSRRIDFSAQNFSVPGTGLEGWRSDRGRVLLRYGMPDAMERPATEPGMPGVEIWSYTRLSKRFIFTDREGRGDFRLVKSE